MIPIQKKIAYSGDTAAAPVKSVKVLFEVPVFEYSAPATEEAEVTRRATSDIQADSITQSLDQESYQVFLHNQFIRGNDDETLRLSKQYFIQGLNSSAVDDLLVNVVVRYFSGDDYELGNESFDLICLPKLRLRSDKLQPEKWLNTRSWQTSKAAFVAVKKQA